MRQGRHLRRAYRSSLPPLLLVLGCTCGCAAPGQTHIETSATLDLWSGDGLTGRRITTDHLEIISTLHDSEFERALPGFLEAAYARFDRTVPAPAGPQTPLSIYVFGTRQDWDRFTQRHFPARYDVYSRIRRGGYTEGDMSVSFYTDRSSTLATLVHEMWHQYLGTRFDTTVPAWLHEGLACYHEAFDIRGGKPAFTPTRNTHRINSLCEAVQANTLLPLREIVDTDAGAVISRDHSPTTQVYYAQAWALITFLKHGAGGRYAEAFDRLLSDVADGAFRAHVGAARLTSNTPDISIGTAAFEAYFGPPDALEDDYYDHLVRVCGF